MNYTEKVRDRQNTRILRSLSSIMLIDSSFIIIIIIISIIIRSITMKHCASSLNDSKSLIFSSLAINWSVALTRN